MDTLYVSFYKPETQKNNIIISTSEINNIFLYNLLCSAIRN